MKNPPIVTTAYYVFGFLFCCLYLAALFIIGIFCPSVFISIQHSINWFAKIIKNESIAECVIFIIINIPVYFFAKKMIERIIKKLLKEDVNYDDYKF